MYRECASSLGRSESSRRAAENAAVFIRGPRAVENIEFPGIEPTNNLAKRGQYPAVIDRKISFGFLSEAGNWFIERLPTLSETCRIPKRFVFSWRTVAVEAYLHYQTASAHVTTP